VHCWRQGTTSADNSDFAIIEKDSKCLCVEKPKFGNKRASSLPQDLGLIERSTKRLFWFIPSTTRTTTKRQRPQQPTETTTTTTTTTDFRNDTDTRSITPGKEIRTDSQVQGSQPIIALCWSAMPMASFSSDDDDDDDASGYTEDDEYELIGLDYIDFPTTAQ
jgi:hypothetical protein